MLSNLYLNFDNNFDFSIPWWVIVLLCGTIFFSVLLCIHKFILPFSQYIKKVYIQRDSCVDFESIPYIKCNKKTYAPLTGLFWAVIIMVILFKFKFYKDNDIAMVGMLYGCFFGLIIVAIYINKIKKDDFGKNPPEIVKGCYKSKVANVVLIIVSIVYGSRSLLIPFFGLLFEGELSIVFNYSVGYFSSFILILEIGLLATYIYYLIVRKFFVYRDCHIVDVMPGEKKRNTNAIIFRVVSLIMCIIFLSLLFENVATVTVHISGAGTRTYSAGAMWIFGSALDFPITAEDFAVKDSNDLFKLIVELLLDFPGWILSLIIAISYLAVLSGILNFLLTILCAHSKKTEEHIEESAITVSLLFLSTNLLTIFFMYIIRLYMIIFSWVNGEELSEVASGITNSFQIECEVEKRTIILFALCIVWSIWAFILQKTSKIESDMKKNKLEGTYSEVSDILTYNGIEESRKQLKRKVQFSFSENTVTVEEKIIDGDIIEEEKKFIGTFRVSKQNGSITFTFTDVDARDYNRTFAFWYDTKNDRVLIGDIFYTK